MARGNGRMPIFLDDEDYTRFVRILGDVVEEFQIECWSYCVLPNHYHATLRPTEPNLSRALQVIHGTYAQWWNRKHGRVGHAFQGRFKDQIVDTDEYLLVLCRYIALNPVRAGLTRAPDEWRWSSYSATIDGRTLPRFLCVDMVLGQFGEAAPGILRTRFARYVHEANGQGPAEDRIRSSTRVLGSPAFQRRIEAEVPEGGQTTV